MSSSQRPTRRRSARLAFDDEEDTRPAKRVKTSDTASAAPAKPATIKKSTASSKKAKASYEEDADGFQFSRAKTKNTRAKEPPPKPEEQELAQKVPEEPLKTARSTATRRKKAEPEAQPIDQEEPRKRRSARLSGDQLELPKVATKPKASSKQKSKEQSEAQPVEQVKEQANEPVKEPLKELSKEAKTPRVEELRSEETKGPTKIALPFADTPVIQRNKEMRKNSAQGHRRSSAGMRGRRASSLMDAGTSNALPHSEVQTSEFYKHISQDLLEPRRMKQLLVWCGTRALPEKPTGTAENVNAMLAARVIQEELLKDFSSKSEMSDWFNREDIAPASLIKKPNPRNVQNAAKLQELELEIRRLQGEKAAWDGVLKDLSTTVTKEAALDEVQDSNTSAINASLLDESDAALLNNLTSQHGLVEDTILRFQRTTQGLEFQIDSLAEGVHKMEKLNEAVNEVADRVQSEAAMTLEKRDQAALERTGMGKVGVGDILRSLARAG